MKIRKIKDEDINAVVELWYEVSLEAHSFVPSEYWKKNKEAMATKYLPNSETYLALQKDTIVGFITMVDNYLAAIFVSSDMQGRGIGTELLNHIKDHRNLIQLKVYKKNSKSVNFYIKQGFQLFAEETEEVTGEIECLMKWKKLNMKDETKLFYDLTAEKTADEWYQNDILLPTIKEFASLLPEAPRVLDLGCGPGHESKRLASLGADVIGIDYSSECIRIAKERCHECEFKLMDFRHLDGSLGRFDGVFASGSLIHITPADLSDVLKNIAAILKQDGFLIMILQDGEGIHEKYSNLEVSGKILRRPVYCYAKDHLIKISSRSNLEFIKEGLLDKNLYADNWRNHIFKRIK